MIVQIKCSFFDYFHCHPVFRSELNRNLLLNLKVFAKFPKTRNGKECTQKLKFKLSDDLYIKDICSKKDSLHRDISLNYQYRAPPGNEPILTFTYSKKNTTEEGKFILQVKGWCTFP